MMNSGTGHLILDTLDFILLFLVDYLAMFDTSVRGLQRKLDILSKSRYCKANSLVVNTEKTKILVFSKVGRVRREERWYYNNALVEVVN